MLFQLSFLIVPCLKDLLKNIVQYSTYKNLCILLLGYVWERVSNENISEIIGVVPRIYKPY